MLTNNPVDQVPVASHEDSLQTAAAKARDHIDTSDARRVLILSSAAFTLLFAVWLMFGVLAIPLRAEMNLTSEQFSWLVAIAILNGACWRLLAGMLTDRIGGKRMMLGLIALTAAPTFLVSYAHTYTHLMICAFMLGLAGNSFSIGIAWNAAWFPSQRQGFAFGIFGAGNVGASVTKLIGPSLIAAVPAVGILGGLVPGGWRFVPIVYGCLLLIMAAALWKFAPKQDRMLGKGRPFMEMLRPLRRMRVWRFSLYYVAVFGAYVALSVWLPRYYKDVYGLPLESAALLTTLFIFPASLLRPLGGYLSDKFGARRVMYWVFGTMAVAAGLLALPPLRIELLHAAGAPTALNISLNVWAFTVLLVILGMGMGIGKAAVYKYIPQYFPNDVGAVGGMVGLLGALGGFFLPLVFGYAEASISMPQATFMSLFGLLCVCLLWLHLVVKSTKSHRM